MVRTAPAYAPTKERLLDVAQELMLSKGFAATTVDDICEAAQLTKGSLFHYFQSKDALGRALLERFCASAGRMHAALCGVERDPLKRVFNYIEALIKLSQEPEMMKGCLLGTFAQELCDEYPDIQEICANGFEHWTTQFGEELARAKARYAPKAAFAPREVAEYLIAITEGSLILAKAKKDWKVMARNLRHFKGHVKSLFGK